MAKENRRRSKKKPLSKFFGGVKDAALNSSVPSDPDNFARSKRQKIPGTDNLHDDSVWGTSWEGERSRLLEEKREDEEDAEEAYQRREAAEKRRNETSDTPIDGNPFFWIRNFPGRQNKQYHVSPDGEVRECSASVRDCPHGSKRHFYANPLSSDYPPKVIGGIVKRKIDQEDAPTLKLNDVRGKNGVPYAPRDILQEGFARFNDGPISRPTPENFDVRIDLRNENMRAKLTMSRHIGNTKDNRWAGHAYWKIENDDLFDDTVWYSDSFTEEEIDKFARNYVMKFYSIAGKNVSGGQREMIKNISNDIKQVLIMTESQVSKINKKNMNHSKISLNFENDFTVTDDGQVKATINYSTSGFDPSAKKFVGLPETENGEALTYAPGFEVFDPDMGDGAANWRAKKLDVEGWEITVQGSRGEIVTKHITAPEEAEKFISEQYFSRVAPYSRSHKKFWGDNRGPEDITPKKRAKNRAEFVKKLVASGLELSQKKAEQQSKNNQTDASNDHRKVFGTAQETDNASSMKTKSNIASKKPADAFDTVFNMLE